MEGFSSKGAIERDCLLFVMKGQKAIAAEKDVQTWLRKIKILKCKLARPCYGILKPAAATMTLHPVNGIYHIFFTTGGTQRPSITSAFGQYMRSKRLKVSEGAGSQLLSLTCPGESCWI
jgi:hypothetical protein